MKNLVAATLLGFSLMAQANTTVLGLGFSRDKTTSAKAVELSAIESSKKTLTIAAYQFTEKTIVQALVDAHKRGVKVAVVLDRSQAKGDTQAALVAAGIDCWIDTVHAIMHHKFTVIDGESVETGSFNYTARAVTRNAENAIWLQDASLAASYQKEWDRIAGKAKACAGGGK